MWDVNTNILSILLQYSYLSLGTGNTQLQVLVIMWYSSTTFESKIVDIFLSINLNICFGCSKEPSN